MLDETSPTDRSSGLGRVLPVGTVIGRYVIAKHCSTGGFASVYRATHHALKRSVAVKVLHPWLVGWPKELRRFQREAEAVNLIRHPHIVDIFDLGELHDGRPYLLMEWLEGVDLTTHLRACGRLNPRETLELFAQLGHAVDAAHQRGIIHRDIKSSNVMLVGIPRQTRIAKLLDFGIAKFLPHASEEVSMSSGSVRVGTLANMAPEQLLAQPIDERTDVYALGVLLFQVLTGRLPFFSRSAEELERMQLTVPVPRVSAVQLDCPPSLDRVISRAMEKEPGHRYSNVGAFLAELSAAIAPAPRPRSPAVEAVRAGALYVEIRVDAGAECIDSALSALEKCMSRTRSALLREGLAISADLGNGLVAGVVLPEDEGAMRTTLQRILDVACCLVTEFRDEFGPRSGVQIAIAAHAGMARVHRTGAVIELVGGDLLHIDSWDAALRLGAVIASRSLVADLPQLSCLPSDDGWFLVHESLTRDITAAASASGQPGPPQEP